MTLINTSPPPWYRGAVEGQERHADGQAWWVREVDADRAIHWAKSPYGKVCAVSCSEVAKTPTYYSDYLLNGLAVQVPRAQLDNWCRETYGVGLMCADLEATIKEAYRTGLVARQCEGLTGDGADCGSPDGQP